MFPLRLILPTYEGFPSLSSKKRLVLFTNYFPRSFEEQFLETEVQFLATSFHDIHIYSHSIDPTIRELPANAKLVPFAAATSPRAATSNLRHLCYAARIFIAELVLAAYRKKYFSHFRSSLTRLLVNLERARSLAPLINQYDRNETVFYSYWFGSWVEILCLVKQIYCPDLKLVTRAHGYDYDINQTKLGFIPFRRFTMQLVSGVYPVSNFAVNRIAEEYPFFEQLERFYLGVSDRGSNSIVDEKAFHIVSCSQLIPLKRVHLIIHILKHLEFQVEWTHFGDGELRDELETLANDLPPNIAWEVRGWVPNQSVIEFYQKQQVDLVINVSTLEGIPVSLMEAISFGVPVVGCDTCGMPEVVTAESGFLIPTDFEPADVAALISDYHLNHPGKESFRKGVKRFWSAHFDADLNYPDFAERCLH